MADRITHYGTIESDSLEELTTEVTRAIAEGWQPIGGIATWQEELEPHYVQALVKMGPQQ